MKAQEGSVKETTFEQMNMCFQHGEFKVGESGSSTFTKVNDIVVLTVESDHARKYTLDELKDLESKLVLITGSRDDRRKQVDGFLDVSTMLCVTLVYTIHVWLRIPKIKQTRCSRSRQR